VRQAAEHLVLTGYQLAGLQLGAERELAAAVPAETLGQARPSVPASSDGLIAAAAEALVLRYLGVGEHRARRVAVGNGRYLDQARAEPAAR
jgi:hypothetical protein